MPRMKLSKEKSREILQHNIELIQGRKTDAQMAKIIGVSAATFRTRKKDPWAFKYGELILLCEKAHISTDLFFTTKLTIGGATI